ncbi:LacI family transcriptional regulator [Chryseobacterium joostei]|uniref:LacI family transcriptional regulator n=1 Tax=Chryseobacterium joostei TaxID=112234 RepID=A0A1N7HV83_9FLAO|nr:LacI family DNA-binding transcriptional regulator [Chryseobacterium joostei]AZA98996.1 LacI family transcriptional regulator [Chryseobacterium joostei]SIS28722.1 transcriptional regulator, LacI family [Chryseobacterium joostei]
MKRPSIKDIATLAGVSVATVSYVLNRKEGQRISEETRKKIFEIAETIKYTPNKIAKSLKTNKTKLLGLIVADISNEFYSNMARSLEDRALKLGYTLIIGSSDENAEKFKKLTELFSQQQVDGMIVAPVSGSEKILESLINIKYPIVTIDRYLKGVTLPGITIDNQEIAERTTSLLISKNFNKIIYVGYKTELPHLLDRQHGFEKAVKYSEKPVEVHYLLVGLENIAEEVHLQLQKMLEKTPENTALYFSSNKLAVAGLSYLVKNNIKVPEQVSVVAFDETDAYDLFPTEITYIQQPIKEMAEEAIKLLDGQINNYIETGKRITLSAKLISKASLK